MQEYEEEITDNSALSCKKSDLIFSASSTEMGKSSTICDSCKLGSKVCIRL